MKDRALVLINWVDDDDSDIEGLDKPNGIIIAYDGPKQCLDGTMSAFEFEIASGSDTLSNILDGSLQLDFEDCKEEGLWVWEGTADYGCKSGGCYYESPFCECSAEFIPDVIRPATIDDIVSFGLLIKPKRVIDYDAQYDDDDDVIPWTAKND